MCLSAQPFGLPSEAKWLCRGADFLLPKEEPAAPPWRGGSLLWSRLASEETAHAPKLTHEQYPREHVHILGGPRVPDVRSGTFFKKEHCLYLCTTSWIIFSFCKEALLIIMQSDLEGCSCASEYVGRKIFGRDVIFLLASYSSRRSTCQKFPCQAAKKGTRELFRAIH